MSFQNQFALKRWSVCSPEKRIYGTNRTHLQCIYNPARHVTVYSFPFRWRRRGALITTTTTTKNPVFPFPVAEKMFSRSRRINQQHKHHTQQEMQLRWLNKWMWAWTSALANACVCVQAGGPSGFNALSSPLQAPPVWLSSTTRILKQ